MHKLRCILAALALVWTLTPGHAQSPDLQDLMAKARAGQADAQVQLAEIYRTGQGVLQNYATAAELYAAAAQQGNADALNALGALYFNGLGVAANPETGADLIARAAALGAPKHIHDYATILQNGSGIAADATRAATLFEQAAGMGWTESAVSLGTLYLEGKGVPKNPARAIELFTAPAEAGHARAQNNLGLIYVRGEGVSQDYDAAVKWFTRAAESGLPTALNNLGVMYQNGFGVTVDEDEAARLYKLAAAQSGGDPAQVAMVFDTRLAPPDPALVESYLASANSGDPVAQFLLGYLMTTVPELENPQQAAALFAAAAQKGMPAAMANLGILSFQGKGTLQDFVEAYKWLTLASASGLGGAIELRDQLATRMTADQITKANVIAQEHWAGISDNGK